VSALRGLVALTAFLALAGAAQGLELPRESVVPGGIKLLRLDVSGDVAPRVEADGHRALVVRDGDGWTAVVGIPLSAPVGEMQVEVYDASGAHPVDFAVADKRYLTQSLKVAPGQVNLSANDLGRVNREHAVLDRALEH
jgi:hypothetical protein